MFFHLLFSPVHLQSPKQVQRREREGARGREKRHWRLMASRLISKHRNDSPSPSCSRLCAQTVFIVTFKDSPLNHPPHQVPPLTVGIIVAFPPRLCPVMGPARRWLWFHCAWGKVSRLCGAGLLQIHSNDASNDLPLGNARTCSTSLKIIVLGATFS